MTNASQTIIETILVRLFLRIISHSIRSVNGHVIIVIDNSWWNGCELLALNASQMLANIVYSPEFRRQIKNICLNNPVSRQQPLKHRPRGASYSRNDPGVWLVHCDSIRRGAHAHIGQTSQRVAKSWIDIFGLNVDFES